MPRPISQSMLGHAANSREANLDNICSMFLRLGGYIQERDIERER